MRLFSSKKKKHTTSLPSLTTKIPELDDASRISENPPPFGRAAAAGKGRLSSFEMHKSEEGDFPISQQFGPRGTSPKKRFLDKELMIMNAKCDRDLQARWDELNKPPELELRYLKQEAPHTFHDIGDDSDGSEGPTDRQKGKESAGQQRRDSRQSEPLRNRL